MSSLSSICPPEGITINLDKWLNSDNNESFSSWKQRMPKRSQEEISSDKPNLNETKMDIDSENSDSKSETLPVDKNAMKRQTKERYLLEKYAYRWRHKVNFFNFFLYNYHSIMLLIYNF